MPRPHTAQGFAAAATLPPIAAILPVEVFTPNRVAPVYVSIGEKNAQDAQLEDEIPHHPFPPFSNKGNRSAI